MQTFWKKTCRELYRRTTLTEVQTRETTDQVLDESMWEEARPWTVLKWKSLKVTESKITHHTRKPLVVRDEKLVSGRGVCVCVKLQDRHHLESMFKVET
jgi:hypothetical protein